MIASNMASIKIAGTVNDSIVDGEGYRFTIFTQGCPHHCEGCQNPQTHAFTAGHSVDTAELLQQILDNPLLSGVTFSGGEPFCQPEPLAELAKKLHEHHLDVWSYSGYTLEELQAMDNPGVRMLLAELDVLVDGKFLLDQRDLTLAFRGSRNQRIIDMNATRQQGQIIEKDCS